MKLTAEAFYGSYKSGKIQQANGEQKSVSLIADGTVDHAVWNELNSEQPGLSDSFVSSLHDPRFHNGGRAGGGDEFGDQWVKGRDDDGFYSQLGDSDGAHQRVYNNPARIKTVTSSFVHNARGNVTFSEFDPTSPRESLELKLPAGATFIED